MNYFIKNWIKKYKKIFNYHHLIEDIMKIKNLYIKKNGKGKCEKDLISKLKSLNNIYLTNNICESIHSKISKNLPKGPITKSIFRDICNFILNDYIYKMLTIKRRDYLTRTLIIIVLKYNLNNEPKFIEFEKFKEELEKTIALMTGTISMNLIDEIFNDLDFIDEGVDIENNSDNNNDFSQSKSINFLDESYNKDSLKDSLNDINLIISKLLKDDMILEEDINISDFDAKNKNIFKDRCMSENNYVESPNIDENNLLDINTIKKERAELNIFTLNKEYNNNLIIILLSKEDKDLESLEEKIINFKLEAGKKIKKIIKNKNQLIYY